MPKNEILVGLSGGVDSAVSAALLVEQGHEVHGVYLKAGSDSIAEHLGGYCPWQEDIADARRVAIHLNIPLTVIDVADAYKRKVIDVMEAEYQAGRTPNPDILCNREMKFGLLLELAKKEGFDAVATGHYARIMSKQITVNSDQSGQVPSLQFTVYELHRGVDTRKDQSYFLWTLNQDQLKRIMFPIGHLTKPEVRAKAHELGLPVAAKKDSQGICFLGPLELRSYLKEKLATQAGKIVTKEGRVVGEHEGAELYTIGQREGLKLNNYEENSSAKYVVEKDLASNEIIIADEFPQATLVDVSDINWITEPEWKKNTTKLDARIRHGQNPQACQLEQISDSRLRLRFIAPQTAIAPGQSVVFSLGSNVLGGAVISAPKALKA